MESRKVNRTTRKQKSFELEALEPRVLLSGDALLVSAVAVDATAHNPVEVIHHDTVAGQQNFQNSFAYNPAGETPGIFEGVFAQPAQTQTATSEVTTVTPSGGQDQSTPVQNSGSAVQSAAKTDTSVSASSTTTISSPTQTVSAKTTSSSSNAMTQQLTASLTTANGPPANSAITQATANQNVSSNSSAAGNSNPVISPAANPSPVNIYTQVLADIANTNGQSSNQTLSYGPYSGTLLGGAVAFTNVSWTFTLNGSNQVSTVSVTADSASLNIGGISSTVGSINGSYNVSTHTFSLTLNNVQITLGSFVNLGANSVSLTYTGGSSGQSVNTINPGNTTTPTSTDTVNTLSLGMNGAYIFAGVNGTANASSTAPGSQAANAEGLSITGVSLALVVMSSTSSSGAVYYGLSESGGTVALVGLPGGFTFNVSNLSVGVNGGNAAANGYAVNFDSSFTSGPGGHGMSVSTGGTPSSVALDFNQPLAEASGTVDINLGSYVYVMGNMSFQAGTTTTVNLTDGTTSTDNGGTVSVSVLEIAANNVTVFAGINGPTSGAPGTIPSNAIGVEINNASFALALMITSGGTKYYGLQASAGGSLVPQGATYNSSGSYTLTGLTSGVTYQWTQGANDTSITENSSTLSTSGATFTAPSGGSITLTGTANAAVTASVAPFGITALGLPSGVTITAGTVSVTINAGVTSGGSTTTDVVDFDTSFTTTPPTGPSYGGLTIQTPVTSGYLDFKGPLLSVSGSLTLDFDGFIYVTGNLSFVQGGTTGTLNLTDGTNTSTTTITSMLEIGASDVTIFAGISGPAINPNAKGIQLSNASFALALIYGADGKTYYGLQASANSLAAVGLPPGFDISGSNLAAAINGSNNSGTVVNFDSSFTSGTGGAGLLVSTGGGNNVTLDFSTQLVQVTGSISLQFSSYLSISGGFDYTQTSGAVTNIVLGSGAYTGASDLTFTVGTSSSTLFTATGSLNMTISAGTTTINSASLTVSEIRVANILDVTSPSLSLSNIAINNATGAISTSGNSTLTITAVSATLFPGSTVLNGSVAPDPNDPVTAANGGTEVNGFNGTFNLSSGAFAVRLGIFTLNVSTVLTATATDVNVTYSPGAGSSQQLVSISSLTATLNGFGNGAITGSVTNLVIYGDGFKFDSATLSYSGDLTLGSVLKLTNPSVTLTSFSVTFDGSNTTLSASNLSVAADSASVKVGAFSATATGLNITISLTDGSTTIVAGSLDFTFGSFLTITATNISINTNPTAATDASSATAANSYLVVGSATATVTAGSFSVTGSVSGTPNAFSVIDVNGTAEFDAGGDFTVTLTTPSNSSLFLPSWLGINISEFSISWTDFNNDPSNFQITLSASINSIQGLPGGVTVSGEITNAVIDVGKLEQGIFPIVSIGSVGGSVSGTLFGMEVNASFVLGIVSFNAENQIVSNGNVYSLTTDSQGNVTETQVTSSPDTTVKNSILYVGVAGGAQIPGVGGVQIYIGFSSLGPLTVYLSAEFPLILDPDTGLAIGGFSGGVIFDYTIPTPSQPQDLATLAISPANITISQWQQQLRDQTVTQYTASSGGTNLSAAYSQPFVIEAGVTIYDAYLTSDAFSITGNMAIQINPANTNTTSIFVSGTATFGASVSFNAYLYLNIAISGPTSTVTAMFLVQEPASTPIETFGGTLSFGFTDSSGNPITTTTVAQTIESEWIAAGATYDSSGNASLGSLPAGTYTWTPGANDTSLTVGGTVYDLTTLTNGSVTFTIASSETASLIGTASATVSGTLSSDGSVTGAAYTITTFTSPPTVAGFYISLDGFASFSAFGTLTATVSGSVTLTVTTQLAKIDLSGDLSVSGLGDLATASGELVVDYSGGISSLQIYGALQIQTGSGFAQLENVGLYVDGAATFILNTTNSPQTVYLPDPNNPHIAADATQLNITDTQSFEVTIAGVGSTPQNPTYASLAYKVGGDTVLNMQGDFDLKISASGLTMFADIHSLSVGPSNSPFLTFTGFGLFVINSQGFAAEMDLSLSSSGIEGITLDAEFTLVMNTTQTDVVYNIPATLPPVTIPGTSNTTRSLTIPAGPPQGALQSDGTFANVGPTGPYIVITGQGNLSIYSYSFTGFFYFQMSDSAAGLVVAMYVNVSGDLGFGTVSVTGGFDLSSAGVVVLLQASGSAGTSTNYGTGVSLQITAELAINTTGSPVSSIGGVGLTDTQGQPLTLNAKSAQVVASGTLTLSFGAGTLVINGIFTTSVVTTGSGVTEVDTTTITANGTLTATVGGTMLITATASGVLVFAAPGLGNPNIIGTNGLGIAGELTLTLSGSNPLSGTGFSYNGTFDMEVNTTQQSQTVAIPGSSSVTIAAGPDGSSFGSAYAEIHANGTLLFGSNSGTTAVPDYNGFVLNGDFYLTVSGTGLSVSANVNLGIYVAGTSLGTVTGTAAMLISSKGFAASLVVTASVDDPAGYYGFGGTLSLQVNTTGAQQTIGSVVIPAGPNGSSSSTGSPYFQVYISGSLALGTTNTTISASSTGLFVSGSFYLGISPSGLTVVANGSLAAYAAGSQLLTLNANGALIINSSGIAGELTLTRSAGDPLDSVGLYSFSGSFSLQLNTTGNNYYVGTDGTVYTSVPPPGTNYVAITAGPDGSTTTPGSFYFEIQASGTLTFGTTSDGFSLNGNLYLVAGAAGLAISANASFTASVGGTTLLTMSASGALIITSTGLAGELTLTFGVGSNNPLDGLGFSFTGTFSLVINTTGNNYYVAGNGSISTSSSGAAYTISAGPNGDTTTPGSVYFEIDANGTLLFGTSANGFELTGDLFLSIGSAGLAVSTNDTFSVNVGGSSVISLTASGAMEITSAGLAASLTLTASSGNDLFSDTALPFSFNGVFTFQLNTTGNQINDTVGNTQLILPKGPYFQIYVSGSLGLGNTSTTTGLFLNGTFYLTISSNGLAIAATANLTATVGGTTLLTLGANGGLVLTSGGLAGAINLTIGSSNPLSGTGFSFTGTFTLQVNTTLSTYYFWSNGTVSTNAPNPTDNPGVSVITTVSAGPGGSSTGSVYFQVYASGAITFGTSSNGFALSGSFYLAVGSAGLAITVTANFSATVLGNQLISVSATGAMEITSTGMAASISLTVPSLGISNVFTLSGTFTFQINTTSGPVSSIGGVTVNLPAGPYFQLSVTSASLTFGGNGAGFELTGSFTLSITPNGMAVSATATLTVKVGGSTLASFSATGALLITSSGIAAKLDLTLTSGFSQSGSTGFSFNASFVLELNTTSSAITTINNVTVNLPRGPYFEILASGSLVMGGFVDITGSFTFILNSSGVLISMNAAVNVFGISFTASGFAIINTSGIALKITLMVGNSTNPTVTLIPGVLALTGSFLLEINTTGNSSFSFNDANGHTVTINFGNTIFEISVNASLNVFGFQMASVSMSIGAVSFNGNPVFWVSGSTTFDFFGFATLNVSFYFDSAGNYHFNGSIYVQLGSDSFNIHGTLSLDFYHWNSSGSYRPSSAGTAGTGFTLRVDGGVTAFDWNFGSIGASVSINGTDVSISVYVSVSFYFFSIGGTVTIDLGSIIPVPAPPPPPSGTVLGGTTTIDGQSFGSGTLLINVGQYANSNRGVAPFSTEDITISISGSTVMVTNPNINGGNSETYTGVTEIVVPDADIGNGTSNINLTITDSSGMTIVIFSGDGSNAYHLAGTNGSITINGTNGNDTVFAGSGHMTFYAGSGANTFHGGTGTATVNGSHGNDTIIGGTGNVTFNVGSGHSTFTGGGTGSTHNTINDPGPVTVSESGYSSYSLVGTSATAGTLTYGGNTDTINNTSGDVTVSLTGAASGTQTFTVTDYYGAVILDNASNSTVTTTITSSSGNLSLTGNTVTESNGPTGTITLLSNGSSTYGTLNLDGGSGANTITVNSWAGTGTVTLDGMGSSDTYVINFQSSGSFTLDVADTGATGTDTMIANGTVTANTIFVSGTAVTLGSQTANYSGLENLTVNTAANNETVVVTSTSTATAINTGSYTDTINVGSNATATTDSGGTLGNIASLLTVSGTSSNDTLNLDDSGDTGARTATLTASTLSGGLFGSGGSLSYSNIKILNLKLGSGADRLNITGTSTTTNVNASLGTNTLDIGSNAATTNTGGVLSNIHGSLTISGSGTTTVNVDDTGATTMTGTLTATTLKGLGMVSSGITYSGLSALNISLGNSGNIFTINNTSSPTTTTLNSGTGADTVNVVTDSGTTIINGQGGGDTINVMNDGATTTINESSGNNTINILATTATTNVNTSSGSNTINVSSAAPALNGVLDGIEGAINITGSGSDTVNVGDTGNTTGRNGTSAGLLTSSQLTGLGMTGGGITYSGLTALNISLGSGNDTMNVQSTSASTVTTINTGLGTNIVNVTSNAPSTSGGVVSGIAGELILNGQGGDTLNFNDTGNSIGGTLTQTTTTLTGLGMGVDGIVYSSIESLNISLGSGNDIIYIQGNPAITTENLNTGSGADIISIGSSAASSIVIDSNPADAYTTIGNQSNATGSVLDNVWGTINITGGGSDTLNVDDSGSNTAAEGGMWSNRIQFLDPASFYTTLKFTVTFTGISGITISLSQANDQFLVADTFTSSSTTPVVVIDGNGGDDTLIIFDSHAVMTINGGSGDDNFYNFGNSAVLYLNGDAGDDTFYVYASVSAAATNVGAGTALASGNNTVYSYRVNSPVNIDGGTGNDRLFIFGTVLDDTFTITSTSVTGAGLDVNFTNIEQVTVAGLGGNDTFYIVSISVPTTIIGDGTIVLPSVNNFLQALNTNLPDLTGGAPPATSFDDTFYVGWQGASYIPGTLANILAPLTILGDNGANSHGVTINQPSTDDTIYVDDSADTHNRTFNLTSATVDGGGVLTGTGFGEGGLMNYDDAVENLNFQMGNGTNTITIDGNDTATQTSVYGGRGNDTFIVNDDYALQSPLALFGGLNTAAGDSLIVNGGTAGNTFDITGFTIDGLGATVNYEEFERLTIYAGGATTFNVNGDSIPTYLNGGAGDDAFNVNSNTVSLYLTSGAGDNSYIINANAGMLTATSDSGNGAGNDSFTVNGNAGTLTLNGGSGNDNFVINGNSGGLTVSGNAGNDSFTVNALSAPATLNGGAGNDTFTVNTPLSAVLTVNGGGDSGDWLTINGTTGNDSVTIAASVVSGIGSAINYTGTNLVVNGVAGNDTFLISGTSTFVTRVNGGTHGNDTFNVQATTGALYLTGGAVGNNTFNLGSLAPVFGGTLANIAGPVFITGGSNVMRLITLATTGVNTVNVDDSGDTVGQNGLLTSSTLTGLGMGAGVTFVSVNTMNIYLGSGSDTFNVQSTNATTVTTLNTGAGANVVNVGSLMPATGGVVSGILGALTVVGGGNDTMNVDDTGDAVAQTGLLTATTLTGLGMGASGITYSGLAALNLSLGSGGNTFTIDSTNASTATTLNSGSGNDTVNLLADSGVTNINSQDGNDTINVQSTGGTTTVNTGTGANTVNVGSLAPATSGVVSGIQGALIVVGSGSDTMNVDNTGSAANQNGTLTATTLTGLGMGASGITYSGLAALNINLGSGNDAFTVTGVSNPTVTTINGEGGTNTAVLNFSGNFAGVNLTMLNFVTGTLYVGGDFSGLLNFSGTLTTVNIVGSLTVTGLLNAGAVNTMTVGGDLAGLLDVTGLLGTLTVDGGTTGEIIAGNVHVITVLASYGDNLFNLIQNGIQREILATPVAGGTMPNTVHFAFVYDSQTAAVPQVAIRITDTNPVARSYNLALVVVNSSTAKFDLSRVDSYQGHATGISNISVWGDMLVQLSAPELQLFTDLSASSRAGVVLPLDNITGVELTGILPLGYIDVTGIEGLAFAILTNANGNPVNVTGPLGQGNSLGNLFGSNAVLNPASDAFVVPFNETNPVRLFVHDNTNNDLEQIMTLTDEFTDNLPVTAYVQVMPTTNNNIAPLVLSVALVGNGGSINSTLSVASITSTGPLGDVTVSGSSGTTLNNAPGLGNITAPSIFGSINVTGAGIYGVIQTTSGDLGQTIVGTNGTITGVTSIFSNGAITGQIISRGNLVSSVSTNGAFSGVIAAQGDLGAIQRDSHGNAVLTGNALTRFGGITIAGNDSGQILALGNVFGNVTISGTMTGRMAVEGRAVSGLAATRVGILGNVSVNSFAAGSAIVSLGLAGDATGGTTVHLGSANGFVAAGGSVNLSSTTIAASNLLQNQTGANLAAISAIFTNGGFPLLFDTGGTLNGLALIETDLTNLKDTSGVLSGTVP